MPRPAATVLIRAKDEAPSIGRTLSIIASQTIADRLQVLVVDSGSTDGTVQIATDAGAELLELAPEEFTYGRALNYGCEHARGDIVISLSAHAFPRSRDWAERMLEPFRDPRVACACGMHRDADGAPLRARVAQDYERARLTPTWGYSNHAGAFPRSLWERRPFRADLPYTEDKEWAWAWLKEGRVVVLDPELDVDHSHAERWVDTYRRSRSEWTGFAMFLDMPHQGPRALLAEWWSHTADYDSRIRELISPRRMFRLLGAYRGRRIGAARSAPSSAGSHASA